MFGEQQLSDDGGCVSVVSADNGLETRLYWVTHGHVSQCPARRRHLRSCIAGKV